MAGVLTQEECAEPKLEPKKEMTARGVVTGERVLVLEHSQTELRETPKKQGMLRAGKGVEDRLVCSCRQYGPKCFCAGDFEGQALVSRPRTEETNEEGRDQAPWALPICPRAVPSPPLPPQAGMAGPTAATRPFFHVPCSHMSCSHY